MHSAKGHTAVDQRWKLQLALAAACRAFAPRASECLTPAQKVEPFRVISYYSYRYL